MDALNVLSIFLVVFLHSRTVFFSNQPVNGYWIEYLISGIGVAAVPPILRYKWRKSNWLHKKNEHQGFLQKEIL